MSEYRPKRGDIVRIKSRIETTFSVWCENRLAIVVAADNYRNLPPAASIVSLRFPDETLTFLCSLRDIEPTGESCALDTP